MAVGKIYRMQCEDPDGLKLRCPKKYDAKCVIYNGGNLPSLKINKGEDLEVIIEKLNLIVSNLSENLTNLSVKVDADLTGVRTLIDTLKGLLRILQGRIDDLEATFCDRVAKCKAVTDLEKTLADIEKTFCDRVAKCTTTNWTPVPNETGCSSSNTEYIAFDAASSTTNGYYLKTFIDNNPLSRTFGQKKYEVDSTKQCLGKGSSVGYDPTETACSCSETTYNPDEAADGCTSDRAIYGFGNFPETNPNAPNYGRPQWRRYSEHDKICNPPSIAEVTEPCRFCSKIELRVSSNYGKQSSISITKWEYADMPDGYSAEGNCLIAPKYVKGDSYTPQTVVATATFKVDCGDERDEWQVWENQRVLRSGTGSLASEKFKVTLSADYKKRHFKEGAYWVCKDI